MNREGIYQIIKGYLPTAQEDFIVYLTAQAEKQIEILEKDLIRKLVLQKVDRTSVFCPSRIDTRV